MQIKNGWLTCGGYCSSYLFRGWSILKKIKAINPLCTSCNHDAKKCNGFCLIK